MEDSRLRRAPMLFSPDPCQSSARHLDIVCSGITEFLDIPVGTPLRVTTQLSFGRAQSRNAVYEAIVSAVPCCRRGYYEIEYTALKSDKVREFKLPKAFVPTKESLLESYDLSSAPFAGRPSHATVLSETWARPAWIPSGVHGFNVWPEGRK